MLARIPTWIIALFVVLIVIFVANALGIVKLHGTLGF